MRYEEVYQNPGNYPVFLWANHHPKHTFFPLELKTLSIILISYIRSPGLSYLAKV
jgi:hypothetical protein